MLKRTTIALPLLLAGSVILISSLSPAQVTPIPVTTNNTAKTSEETQVMMQAKLGHSQKVLEGLVTQDFKSIEKAAAALSKISLTPPPDLTKAGDKTDEQGLGVFILADSCRPFGTESHEPPYFPPDAETPSTQDAVDL